jgi:hypothetical protein
MNAFMRGAAKAMRMDSSRAASYLGKGSKNATRLMDRAATASANAIAAGRTGAQYAPHNMAIRARQMQLGTRYAAGAVGVGVLGSQGKNRSSYRPPRPMTQAPSGSGRFA